MMKKKSPLWALLWLLLIPGQIVVGTGFIALGAYLDSQLFSERPPDTLGHGMPVFSLILSFVVVIVTIFVLILAIVLAAGRAVAISRRNRAIDEAQRMGQPVYPYQPINPVQQQYPSQPPYQGQPADQGMQPPYQGQQAYQVPQPSEQIIDGK